MNTSRLLRPRHVRTAALVFSMLLWVPGLLPAQDSPPPPPNGPGQALSFDGVNDRLIANPFALPSGNDPYTIEAWINPTTMHTGTIAAWGHFGFADQVNAFRLTPTGLVNYWWGNDLSVTVNLVGGWHHVAATYDGTTRRIVVDGVVLGSDPVSGHDATESNFSIGSANGGEFFSGTMDEVRIWNVSRNPLQIRQTMRRQLTGSEGGLVGYWRFDEGTGLMAFDGGDRAENTATLVDGPVWVASSIVPFAPPLSTQPATAVSTTGATLNGLVDGRTSVTAFEPYFQWGATESMASEQRFGFVVSPGAAPQSYSVPLTGLRPGGTYFYRAVAANAQGTSFGSTMVFTLPFPPTNVVINDHDSGPGSLRDAIAGAVFGGTVEFAPNLTGVIRLTSGELPINNDLTLRGPGAGHLSISGNQSSRVFHIGPNANAFMSGLTIRDGLVQATGVDENGDSNFAIGGGIWNEGALVLTDCLILSNRVVGADSPSRAGGGGEGGGVFHSGTRLNIIRCTVRGNTARGGSGGAHSFGGGLGGTGSGGGLALRHRPEMIPATLEDSTVDLNVAVGGQGGTGRNNFNGGDADAGSNGGRGEGGGIRVDYGLIATSSAIISNLAVGGAGGLGGVAPEGSGGHGGYGQMGAGGGVAMTSAPTDQGFPIRRSLANCTVSGNIARGGDGGRGGLGSTSGVSGDGGQADGGGLYCFKYALTNCTITANRAVGGPNGGGLLPGRNGEGAGGGFYGSCSLLATIVAGNFAVGLNFSPDIDGEAVSYGFNLVGDPHGARALILPFQNPSDQLGAINGMPVLNPMLSPLADHGGPTLTHALLPGSPAHDRGGGGLTSDQRGRSRPVDWPGVSNGSGDGGDVGAFEMQADEFPALVVQSGDDSGPGSLRESLAYVAPGGTISFSRLNSVTVRLTTGELVVDKSVNIVGWDPRQITVSGNHNSRVFKVTAGQVFISGLTVRDGLFSVGATSEGGGLHNSATLTVSNCTFEANAARGVIGTTGRAGAPAAGGALYNAGRLTLLSCTFVNNEALGGDGGRGRTLIDFGGSGGPGGDAGGSALANESESPLEIFNCTFVGNGSAGGSGGAGGGGNLGDGAGGNGGNATGGAFLNRRGNATLLNVSIVDNGSLAGAPGLGGISGLPGTASGGGVQNLASGSGITLRNCLVARNRATTSGLDVSGVLTSAGHNLIGVTNGAENGWLATDRVGSLSSFLDPRLGDFALHFGLTRTYALRTDSPALDAGDDVLPSFLALDQRGFPRRSGAHVDIGAFEVCTMASYVVTTLEDDVVGSLRAGIECATAGGTISFAPEVTGVILLSSASPPLEISKDLRIIGPGADRLRLATTNTRVLRVASGQVQISGLTFSGTASGANGADGVNATEDGGNGEDAEGGGILNLGDLTVTDCMFEFCNAFGGWGGRGGVNFGILAPGKGGSGGGARGAGVSNQSRLALLRCSFINNQSYGGRGGTGGEDGHVGSTPGGLGGRGGAVTAGALYNSGSLFMTNCTFATNTAAGGMGGTGGYGIPAGGQGGNGGEGIGAGLANFGTVTIVSCTLADNDAEGGGPGAGGTGSSMAGPIGSRGLEAAGGLYFATMASDAFVRNTLSAGNRAGDPSDSLGLAISGGFNFIGSINAGTVVGINPFTALTDQVGEGTEILEPRLGTLDFHGGTTLTLALQPDSPAHDKGDRSGTTTDQRGVARPVDDPAISNAPGGDGSDIGAYEFGPLLLPILSIRLAAANTVILSWPNPSAGYVLQQTANMGAVSSGWADVMQPPVVNGTDKEVTLLATGRACLFRLRRP